MFGMSLNNAIKSSSNLSFPLQIERTFYKYGNTDIELLVILPLTM